MPFALTAGFGFSVRAAGTDLTTGFDDFAEDGLALWDPPQAIKNEAIKHQTIRTAFITTTHANFQRHNANRVPKHLQAH